MNEDKNQGSIQGTVRDIVIIGGGPAGFTAGIYAARGRMNTLMIESLSVMGQATMTEVIENYPGIETISGFSLIGAFRKQAVNFGLEVVQGTVEKVSCREKNGLKIWKVEHDDGAAEAFAVVVASGASPKKLGVPGEQEFTGRGVSYCATCDGAFFKGRHVIVVGGGDTAVGEALYLTRFASKVTIVHRRDRLRASAIIQERARSCGKIDFLWNSVVEKISGGSKVENITVHNVKANVTHDVACDGVFVFTGWTPNTSFLNGLAKLDKSRAVITDHSMETSAEGIFAAGDCTSKVLRQVVTACGDGATAAFSAQHYVEELKGTAYN